MLKIVPAAKEDLQHIQDLFKEYAESLSFDLSFQDFEHEFSELPDGYVLPEGRLLIAKYGSKVAGCVALRKIDKATCEMKRLFVRKGFRGKKIGKSLAESIVEEARQIGYLRMRLDTTPEMQNAIRLYQTLGFETIEPYRVNPVKGATFMELNLEK